MADLGSGAFADRYLTSGDGLRLHYRDYPGSGARLPMVMLHGLTRNARDFALIAAHCSGKRRIIVPDFRGRGLSDHDPDSSHYQPATYAGDIVALLDALGIGSAIFLGTSLGGIVTMLIGTFSPDRVAASILNDIGPDLDPAGLDRIRSYVGTPGKFTDWDDAAATLGARKAQVHPTYDAAAWADYARRVARETPDGVEFDYDFAIAEPFAVANDAKVDGWPYFKALADKPILILRGALSDLLPASAAEAMAAAAPLATLVTIPDVGHPPDLMEPASVAAIDSFLADLP